MKRFKNYILSEDVTMSPGAFVAMVNKEAGKKAPEFARGIHRFRRKALPGEDPEFVAKASIDIFKLLKRQGYKQVKTEGDKLLVFAKDEELAGKDNTRAFNFVTVKKDLTTGWFFHTRVEDAEREEGEGTPEREEEKLYTAAESYLDEGDPDYELLCESIVSTIKVYLAGSHYTVERVAKIFQSTYSLYKPNDLKKFIKMTNSLANDPKFKIILNQLMAMVGA